MMKNFLLLFIIIAGLYSCNLDTKKKLFAIVVDSVSYSKVKNEIDSYAKSVNEDGLNTKIIVVDSLITPDSIRNILQSLYLHDNLEGSVFVGDIPIPMIRDAQHLTTAFKINQKKFNLFKTSVPSDRFYEDFDLEFSFIKKDTVNPLCYYYSLNYDSPQNLTCDIYSGRIKPNESSDKYIALGNYFAKLVKIKKQLNLLDEVLVFKGHGYNSESQVAFIDEVNEIKNHLPILKKQNLGLSVLNFDYDTQTKHRLLGELSRDDLDLAILNNHGSKTKAYLSRNPSNLRVLNTKIEDIKRSLRLKIYDALKHNKANVEKIKEKYISKYGVSDYWFNYNDSVFYQDSLFEANKNLVLKDLSFLKSNSKVIILNSCFNGSFHQKKYLAAGYIFNHGNTVVAQGNTVNVLQDKWVYRYIGLLGIGMRIGQWNKLVCSLETHIIGDPTFHFAINKKYSKDLNVLLNHSKKAKAQLELIKSNYDDIKAMAIRNIVDNKFNVSDSLFYLYKNSESEIVRREAIMNLFKFDDNNLIEAIKLACMDSNEGIRRQTMHYIKNKGNDEFITPLLSTIMRNNVTKRVKWSGKVALSICDSTKLNDIYNKQFKELYNIDFINKWNKNFTQNIFNPHTSDKQILSYLRLIRNNTYHPEVENFCNFIYLSQNKELQIAMLESLSWFYKSYKKEYIVKTCNNIINNKEKYDLDVRKQAQKTMNIINDLSLNNYELTNL